MPDRLRSARKLQGGTIGGGRGGRGRTQTFPDCSWHSEPLILLESEIQGRELVLTNDELT